METKKITKEEFEGFNKLKGTKSELYIKLSEVQIGEGLLFLNEVDDRKLYNKMYIVVDRLRKEGRQIQTRRINGYKEYCILRIK